MIIAIKATLIYFIEAFEHSREQFFVILCSFIVSHLPFLRIIFRYLCLIYFDVKQAVQGSFFLFAVEDLKFHYQDFLLIHSMIFPLLSITNDYFSISLKVILVFLLIPFEYSIFTYSSLLTMLIDHFSIK